MNGRFDSGAVKFKTAGTCGVGHSRAVNLPALKFTRWAEKHPADSILKGAVSSTWWVGGVDGRRGAASERGT